MRCYRGPYAAYTTRVRGQERMQNRARCTWWFQLQWQGPSGSSLCPCGFPDDPRHHPGRWCAGSGTCCRAGSACANVGSYPVTRPHELSASLTASMGLPHTLVQVVSTSSSLCPGDLGAPAASRCSNPSTQKAESAAITNAGGPECRGHGGPVPAAWSTVAGAHNGAEHGGGSQPRRQCRRAWTWCRATACTSNAAPAHNSAGPRGSMASNHAG